MVYHNERPGIPVWLPLWLVITPHPLVRPFSLTSSPHTSSRHLSSRYNALPKLFLLLNIMNSTSSISALLDEFENMSPPPRSSYTPPPYFADEYQDYAGAIMAKMLNEVSRPAFFSAERGR